MKRFVMPILIGMVLGVGGLIGILQLQDYYDPPRADQKKDASAHTYVVPRRVTEATMQSAGDSFDTDAAVQRGVVYLRDQANASWKDVPKPKSDDAVAFQDATSDDNPFGEPTPSEHDESRPTRPSETGTTAPAATAPGNLGPRTKTPVGIPGSPMWDPNTFSPAASSGQAGVRGGKGGDDDFGGGGFGVGGGKVVRMVPRTRTVVERYMQDGQLKTREHQVTEYVAETINSEEQAEIAAFRKAVEALKSAKEEAERSKATEELRGLMHKYFERDMDRREKDLVEAEGRVKKLRDQFDKRKAAEGEIVNLRLQLMINEATGLGFSLPFDEEARTLSPTAVPTPFQSWAPQTRDSVPSYQPPVPNQGTYQDAFDSPRSSALEPMIDGPGPGVAPPPVRQNSEQNDGGTFEPRQTDPAPEFNPGSSTPMPKPTVSEPGTATEPEEILSPDLGSIESPSSLTPSEKPREGETETPAASPELEAIEAEANNATEDLLKEEAPESLEKEVLKLEESYLLSLKVRAKVNVLIKNLTFPVETRSIVAAKELARQGKNAAAAIPELERLINMERDSKGFPSDKQREAFREALEKIKAAIQRGDLTE